MQNNILNNNLKIETLRQLQIKHYSKFNFKLTIHSTSLASRLVKITSWNTDVDPGSAISFYGNSDNLKKNVEGKKKLLY